MDKVVKALEQAQRDRGLRGLARPAASDPHGNGPTPGVPSAISSPSAYSVPHIARLVEPTAEGIDAHLVSLLDPISLGAEQYRSLRYVVEQAHRVDNVSIIAVSAATIGDGKTTTAINLAGALAQASDARVVLIDADLRRPALHRYLGLGEARRGLVDAILDPTLTLVDVVRPVPPFNLSVLPAGTTTASPYELLKSERLGQLFEEARLQYDYVVVDTPPLIPVPDCRIIGKHVDGFLLVVRAHKTRTKHFDEAARVLDSSKVIGVVFNGSDGAALGKYAADAPNGSATTESVGWRRRGFLAGRQDRSGRHSASR